MVADITGLLAVLGPESVLSAITVLVATGIVLYTYMRGHMFWAAIAFMADGITVLLRLTDDLMAMSLSIVILFTGGILAGGAFFMSAYRSWQDIYQTEEAEAAERVEI